MEIAEDMAARHGRMLAEIAEIALGAARKLGQALDAAETAHEQAVLMGALHRAGRSVRQSVALEAKLARDGVKAVREAAAEGREDLRRKVERRKAQVEAAVKRILWTERESEQAERLENTLQELVSEDAVADDFLIEAIELQIARLCEQLGLQGAAVLGEASPPATDGGSAAVDSPATQSGTGGDPGGASSGGTIADELEFDAAPPPELRSSA